MVIRVLLVDDHELVRTGISRMLADVDGIEVIGQGASGEEAVSLSRELGPDVVLMDIQMPGIGGLEATRKIVRQQPEVKIIIVTVCEDEPFPTKLMDAGASGYITKGAPLEVMVSAIKSTNRGKRFIQPEIAQTLALRRFDQESDSPFEQLSERELQIAMMIVNCHKVAEISDSLFLSPKTVNSYRYRLFEKLGIQSDVELVLLAVRHGMVNQEMLA